MPRRPRTGPPQQWARPVHKLRSPVVLPSRPPALSACLHTSRRRTQTCPPPRTLTVRRRTAFRHMRLYHGDSVPTRSTKSPIPTFCADRSSFGSKVK